MSSGSDSGHQSRLVRPSSERTVVGRSTGQPIDPVLASMLENPPGGCGGRPTGAGPEAKTSCSRQSEPKNRLLRSIYERVGAAAEGGEGIAAAPVRSGSYKRGTGPLCSASASRLICAAGETTILRHR